MKRIVLVVLLALNTLLEVGGGIMMILKPEELGRDTFGLAVRGDAAVLVVLIGGVTLSYSVLSAVAAVGVLRRRPEGRSLVTVLGVMLAMVGVVMLSQGMRIGAFDLAKGVAFVLGGLAARLPATSGSLVRA
jgi:hypothetical protein